ncbi:hypothetical protein [Clostridium frigoriphilum]|uniref:Uncharacterized protein n=1 Tax=Clostridium frigoriphilum TaxID=443253 RepID=A0ABU7UJQ9_9CLOT
MNKKIEYANVKHILSFLLRYKNLYKWKKVDFVSFFSITTSIAINVIIKGESEGIRRECGELLHNCHKNAK